MTLLTLISECRLPSALAPLLADAPGVLLFLLFLAGAFLNFLFKKGGLIEMMREQASKKPLPPAGPNDGQGCSQPLPPTANPEEARLRKLMEALGQAGRGGSRPPLSPFPGSAGKPPVSPPRPSPAAPPPLPNGRQQQRPREREPERRPPPPPPVAPDQRPPTPREPAVSTAPSPPIDRRPPGLPAIPAVAAAGRGRKDATDLRKLLRDPTGSRLRQAILLQEILGTPRGLSEWVGPVK